MPLKDSLVDRIVGHNFLNRKFVKIDCKYVLALCESSWNVYDVIILKYKYDVKALPFNWGKHEDYQPRNVRVRTAQRKR